MYGDPALLVPAYFAPRVEKTHKYGIVARWSEERWREAGIAPDVKLIDLGSADVEGVIEEMLSCRYIITGSLHGLIMADAYGIPSAWVITGTAEGGAFKFFDYFSTVNKFRNSQPFDFTRPVTAARLRDLDYDSRPIRFDHRKLLDACPFLQRVDSSVPRVTRPAAARLRRRLGRQLPSGPVSLDQLVRDQGPSDRERLRGGRET